MACKVCFSDGYIDILDKNAIAIWTGSAREVDDIHPCNLRQCTKCGHVYEEVSAELSEKLTKIYRSVHAQASTTPGDGAWGLKRAEFFLNKINYKEYSSAIEIGCADGYFLKFLENYGYKTLVGIDPSLPNDREDGIVKYISAFANEETLLGYKVDLIYSNAVFEHIEGMNGVLQFCKNHLAENGELFFAVPNAQRELEDGDPALFIHEHIHYYTNDAIKYLLAKNGFEAKSIIQECSAIYVSAVLNDAIELPVYTPTLYKNYSALLESKIKEFETIMHTNKNIIVHGTNNKLNNILGWSSDKFSYTLVDNDKNKCNQNFFNHKVEEIKNLNLQDYDAVIIIPTCFYESIERDYIDAGFAGKFYKI